MVFHSSLKKQVLERLLYSEVFQHPLTTQEISASIHSESVKTHDLLSALVASGLIFEQDGFYGVFDPENKVEGPKKERDRPRKLGKKPWKGGLFKTTLPFNKPRPFSILFCGNSRPR